MLDLWDRKVTGFVVNGITYHFKPRKPQKATKAEVKIHETLGLWQMREETMMNLGWPWGQPDPRLDGAVRKFLGIGRHP